MLKKRIIPIQLLENHRLVKTLRFESRRDVGDPVSSSTVYSAQDADELIFLNINRENRSIRPLIEVLDKVAESCFMPLAVGGGIQSLADAETLFKHGADKITINSAAFSNPALITEIAGKFGTQAVVISIDVKLDGNGRYVLYSGCGQVAEAVAFEDHVRKVTEFGAGELLVNSIDRDGTMTGYDLELLKLAMRVATLPVIACGGAGLYMHMKDAFLETDVSALACGSLFNFGDNNPIRAKAFLSNYGIPFKVI